MQSRSVGFAIGVRTPILPATLIGVITATFGGVLRDVLCDRTPRLFQPTEPVYATCSFLGAWSNILLHRLGFPHTLGLLAFSTFTLISEQLL